MRQFAASLLVVPKASPSVGEMLTFQNDEAAKQAFQTMDMDNVAMVMGRDEPIYLN